METLALSGIIGRCCHSRNPMRTTRQSKYPDDGVLRIGSHSGGVRASLILAICAAAHWASAIPIYTVDFSGSPVSIPDGSAIGLGSSQQVSSIFNSIDHLSVTLDISGGLNGGWNGDLYAYLLHDGVMVVLLNRPGVTAANPIGYGDSGLNVTLDDNARVNIHNYQSALPSTHFAGALTGNWAPDGRTADPNNVTDQSPVTTSLSMFDGLDPNGTWTLFLMDAETGGLSQLQSWSLNIEASTNVPDRVSTVLLLLLGLCPLGLFKRLAGASRMT